MKKAILIFALATSVVFSAFGVSAQDCYPTKGDDGNYSYTVKVNLKEIIDNPDDPDLSYGSSMYGLVAVLGTDNAKIEDGNIVYIDQATSTEDGMLVFSGFLPMGPSPDAIEPKQGEGQDQVIPASDGEAGTEPGTGAETGTETDDPATGDPTDVPDTDDPADNPADEPEYFEECTLFIGGPGFEGAKEIGVLKDASGVLLTGKVKDDVSSKETTITVFSGDNEIVTTETDSNGNFALQVPAGTDYSVEFSKEAYLTLTYTNVDVEAGLDIGEVDITKMAGDITINGYINVLDLNALLKDFNKDTSVDELENEFSDLTENGYVNILDLNAMLAGFNGENTSKEYKAPVME